MTSVEQPDPIPFEITQGPDGIRVASNGHLRVTLLEQAQDGRLFRRRGVKGFALKPAGETILPKLNQLAGELLANPSMAAEDVQLSLLALAGLVQPQRPEKHEWAVVELDGVRVYVAGNDVVVTRKDLSP